MIQQESAFNWYYIIFIYILILIDIKESNRINLCIETARHILYLYVNLCYFERGFGGCSQEQAHNSLGRSAGIHRLTNAFKGHSLSIVKSIIDSHLKEEALLTVHSQNLNRLRPPYLVVVSDSNNNTGNCSARKLSIHWWSESVMRQFSRIEKKGNLLLLDNKRTETSFPSYISHFIPLNLSLTFWILEKVLIMQVSAICMLIFTYLQKPQFWINKTAGDR